MQGNSLQAISLSLEQSGKELDGLTREIKQYGFWLGLEAPETVMEYGWLPKVQVPAVFKNAATKINTFVQRKVIAPVQKAATVVKQIQRQAAKVAGAAVTSTINTLKAVKNQGVTLLNQAKTATKDRASALAAKAAEAAKKVAVGLDALKKNLSSRISANINKFITTGQNLLNSARKKVTSSASHLAKAKAALARLKAKVAARRRKKMGFDSFEDAIKSDPDYIQFGIEINEGKADIVSAQGDANGAAAATTDVDKKAGAGVTVAPEEAKGIGSFISSTVSVLYRAATFPIRTIYNAAKSVLLTVAEYLGLYTSLESQMKQAVKEDEAANAAVEKAKEAQVSATTQEAKAIADTAYANAVAQKEQATASIEAAAARAVEEGAPPQEAVDKMNALRTEPVPAWAAPAYTPAEQAAAPQIAGDAAVDTQEGYVAVEREAYADLADKAGTGMAVETDLANAKTASDVNAIGAAVEEGLEKGAPEGEGEPSKLPYIAGGLAVLGAGYYLLTKKKGGSYAQA